MKLRLHPKTNVSINHMYTHLEIDLKDADYKLIQNIIENILEVDGVQTLSEVLTEEDLTQLFLDRRESFKDIYKKYGETL